MPTRAQAIPPRQLNHAGCEPAPRRKMEMTFNYESDDNDYGYDQEDCTVLGATVQHDRSGVGHCWKDVDADDIPADARTEIEGEIVDGQRSKCTDFVASNGRHYRWE